MVRFWKRLLHYFGSIYSVISPIEHANGAKFHNIIALYIASKLHCSSVNRAQGVVKLAFLFFNFTFFLLFLITGKPIM